jgi:hypothetical protein
MTVDNLSFLRGLKSHADRLLLIKRFVQKPLQKKRSRCNTKLSLGRDYGLQYRDGVLPTMTSDEPSKCSGEIRRAEEE